MARTKQKLINYHSSGSSSTNVFNPVNVDYGEIAVRHKPDEARLYVRTGENTYATFVDSSQTVVMINEMNQNTLRDLNYISGSLISVSGALVTLSDDFETVSAQVVSNINSITAITKDLGELNSNFTSFSAYIESDYKDWEKTQEYIDNKSTNLTQEINKLSGSVIAFSSSVITNYATKTEVASASANAISSAKTYVDAVSGDIETTIRNEYATSSDTHSAISGLDTKIENLNTDLAHVSGGLYAFSAKIITEYATKTEVASASANAISSAKTYVDAASGSIETTIRNEYATSADTHNAIDTVKTGLDNRIDGVNTNLSELSGSVSAFSATVVSMEDDLIDRIESALTIVYKFKGTVDDYEDLAGIENPKNGDVYNVVNAQGTIGESGYTPPGTNYAWVAPNGDDPEAEGYVAGHWDELGGQVDLSEYVTRGELSAATATTEGVMMAVYSLSGAVSAFSSSVITNYATKTEVASASANAISSAKTYVDAASGNIETTIRNEYATSADTHNAISDVDTKVENLDTYLNYVSGGLYAFSAKVISDYATSSATHSAIAAASGNVYKSSTAYTNTVSGYIETTIRNEYATSSDTHNAISDVSDKIDTTNQIVETLSGSVIGLSGSVISVKATADAALNEFKLGTVSSPTSTQSGAKASYVTGGSATLDLSELVIDCGDF